MKKTLIALLAIGSVATATNYYGGATTNPFAECASKYTLGQDYTLTFNLGFTTQFRPAYDGATLLILDATDWSVATQQGRYIGMDEEANGVTGSNYPGYPNTSITSFNTENQKQGWFYDFGSNGAINGITIKVEGKAATNTTVLSFPKDDVNVTMTINKLLNFKDINVGTAITASNIKFSTPSVPEPTTGSLSLLALAGLCARRRKH